MMPLPADDRPNATGHVAPEAFRDFGPDPWRLVVHGIDGALTGEDETLFSLGNGYLGLRGNHEEGLPLGAHGTFVNGLHETWRIQHAENAYGFAEHGQTIVNAPDAKTIRVYVDDERLNLETSDILEVRRTLDMRSGVLERSLLWLTPTGKRVSIETRRMVSFSSRHLATLEMRITLLDADAELTVNSLLINRQDLGRVDTENPGGIFEAVMTDPRKSEQLAGRVLEPGPARHHRGRSVVSYRVRNSGMRLGVGVDHEFDSGDDAPLVFDGIAGFGEIDALVDDSVPGAWHARVETSADRVRHMFQGTARRGRTVRLVKTVAYHSSSTAALPELLDRCVHTLEQAAAEPAESRWERQRAFLDEFWSRSDVRVDAEPGVQQAVRWNLFQIAQAAARADGRGIPAKGLTGSGYSGHYFWDSEIYALPFLSYTTPLWARNALRARERMLDQARTRAQMLSEEGALFPWRTINGEEASAYYAAGTAAYHINADITYALARYVAASGDLEFMLTGASEIPIETARLWCSLGFWRQDPGGGRSFHIHGVTGPDEYTTVVNDNLFTNVMARFNLRFAVEVARRLRAEAPEHYAELAERLRLDPSEVDAWERAAEGMSVPYSDEMGIHPQDAHFLEREVWDLAATPPEQKPLLLHFHPLVIYRFQVLKQADVVLALLLASDEFSREEKRRDFEYYDALTTGDSTLSAVVQSIIAAEVGYRELAYRYFEHALHVDLDNLHQNSSDGVHIASAGGVWMALVQGFAGMRDAGRTLRFDPRLPEGWGSLEFKLAWRGGRLGVRLEPRAIRFEVVEGEDAIEVSVRGETVEVAPGFPRTVALEDQGPDLGAFAGLSAGILPHEGDTGAVLLPGTEVPIITTTIPTIPTVPSKPSDAPE
ncbi:glycosyl hydrolase family 65 protein [Leucobacter ruminantium]